MKLSIIVPVYNVRRYLGDCLDSIRAQTFTDWECICVDDGSTDGSGDFLDEYARLDSRFSVIHRAHSNAGACRNAGMSVASGEYLAFLDSDDVFSPYLYEVLMAGARQFDADIIACKHSEFFDEEPCEPFAKPKDVHWEEVRVRDSNYKECPFCALQLAPWNKIYKHSVVIDRNLRFLEQSSTNDLTFVSTYITVSRRNVLTTERLIKRRLHQGSIQATKHKNTKNVIAAFKACYEEMSRLDVFENLAIRRKFARFSIGALLWELSCMRSPFRYRSLYKGIKSLAEHYDFIMLLHGHPDINHGACLRLQKMIGGDRRENVRAFFEGVLSPLLGTKRYARGGKLRLINRINYEIQRRLG